MRRYWLPVIVSGIILVGGFAAYQQAGTSLRNMWLTPAQQYERQMKKENYEEAARRAVDPMQKGAALYMAGQFKEAGSVFGASSSEDALYNRANSFVMQGKYDEAIASYEKALQKSPDWQEARDNLELARLRKEKMAPPEDDAGGTGGQLEADEIVFDDRERGQSSTTEESQQKTELSENEQLALWLRKVETKPADFLRLKFSYQLSRQEQ